MLMALIVCFEYPSQAVAYSSCVGVRHCYSGDEGWSIRADCSGGCLLEGEARGYVKINEDSVELFVSEETVDRTCEPAATEGEGVIR